MCIDVVRQSEPIIIDPVSSCFKRMLFVGLQLTEVKSL